MFFYRRFFVFCIAILFFANEIFGATMNPRVRKVPQKIQEQIFVSPKETLPDLVAFLVQGSSDTAAKVKILHDWICDNIAYDTDVFSEQGAGPQGIQEVLTKRRAVCVGYANLMAVMCSLANVEAEIVTGWSKGFNYPGYLREKSDHAWNAIKIGGKWKLIDVTWDAGFVEGRTFIKNYTLEWYNLTPAQFIYSHLPEDEKWQLLPKAQIRSPEQFVQEPYLSGRFFDYGLSLGKDAAKYKNEISDFAGFDFSLSKAGVVLFASLQGDNPDVNTENFVWTQNLGKNIRFLFDVPDKKVYTFWLGAKENANSQPRSYFSKSQFEQSILPSVQNLLDSKKITQTEADLFVKSYTLVAENGRYYFLEDLFDNLRNQANKKITNLLNLNSSFYEEVLSVKVFASSDYDGCGNVKMRFPQMYQSYQKTANIRVNSPLNGSLAKESEQHFSVSTTAYSKLAIVLGKEEFFLFTKNNTH